MTDILCAFCITAIIITLICAAPAIIICIGVVLLTLILVCGVIGLVFNTLYVIENKIKDMRRHDRAN